VNACWQGFGLPAPRAFDVGARRGDRARPADAAGAGKEKKAGALEQGTGLLGKAVGTKRRRFFARPALVFIARPGKALDLHPRFLMPFDVNQPLLISNAYTPLFFGQWNCWWFSACISSMSVTVPSARMNAIDSGISVFFIQKQCTAVFAEDEQHTFVRRETRAIT